MSSRRRKWLIGSAAVVVLVGVSSQVVPPLLFGDRTDYGPVVSIERNPEYQDPALLARAWQLPVARLYGPDQVDYQKNPSFCGPASIVNVDHTLGRAEDQGTVLEGTGQSTFLGGVLGGLTLDELAAIARIRTGRSVTVLRDFSLEAFRAEVARSNDLALRYIVNFTRKPLFGRGGGHHSPIGGYLADRDLVLVVDVNRKYRPWLVPVERLWQATRAVDRSSGKPRGLLRIE